MCGICGFNWDDKQLIEKMAKTIHYRGPDQDGYYTDKYISLGHKRLSIIDLSINGKQPMYNEDESILIIFNGEIYNFKQIRIKLEAKGHKFHSNTDTETIIHTYEEYGVNCLSYFEGMFAFAIYDKKNKKIFVARDRLGKKPLYYYNQNDSFIFASEIKAILEYELKRTVNVNVLNKMLMLRYMPGHETILQNIFKLEPGHFMIYDLNQKKLNIKQYWDIKEDITKKTEQYFIKKIQTLIEEAVEKRLVGDVPIGLFLSGGLDSSAILAYIKKINPEKTLRTYSVGFENISEYNELSYAKETSDYFSTEHKEVIINSKILEELPKMLWHLDEPISDPAIIPNYKLSEMAQKKVKIVLTGDGADELFAGYDQYKFLKMGYNIRNIPMNIKTVLPKLMKIIPSEVLNIFYKYSKKTGNKMINRFAKFVTEMPENKAKSYLEIISIFDEEERKNILNEQIIKKIPDFTNYDMYNKTYFSNKWDFLNQVLYLDTKTVLPEDFLMKPDKMGMAHSIEARVPFLDHKLVELAFKIPPNLKMNGLKTKYIFKKAIQPILPKQILKRKKQTFYVPIEQWTDEMSYLINRFANKQIIEKQGYFNQINTTKLFSNKDKTKLYYSRQIWNILNFEIWHELFINENHKIKIQL
ncbi:MAG: asparagine synthase (glutamine-hydrolyzing) [DPANN group archaeon]|nr:asparagine synthase (glutamine-hydrolyzing) [DPANN group archaeon]